MMIIMIKYTNTGKERLERTKGGAGGRRGR